LVLKRWEAELYIFYKVPRRWESKVYVFYQVLKPWECSVYNDPMIPSGSP